jgi:5-methylcytosine-specific restriction enzyme A
MRKRLPEYLSSFPVTQIDLGSKARLPTGYVAGHALGLSYDFKSLPTEDALQADLQNLVAVYRVLIFRNTETDEDEDVQLEFKLPKKISIIEKRKYVFHRKIERNPNAARQAKKFHGTRCQACDLDFSERYGEISKGFIEAHHLRPIGSLEEGVAVTYDVAADFAVLCANCHRMIHRSTDPSNLGLFRANLASNKT